MTRATTTYSTVVHTPRPPVGSQAAPGDVGESMHVAADFRRT
jgi:hypothetical protein